VLPEALASLARVHVGGGRFQDGLEAYRRAGESAERQGDNRLAAEMHRCAGHAALNANLAADAKASWGHAFELLGSTSPMLMTLDEPAQLVVLALSLAELFEGRGELAAARDLRGHATTIERSRPKGRDVFS
jgi:hypothetical protein